MEYMQMCITYMKEISRLVYNVFCYIHRNSFTFKKQNVQNLFVIKNALQC